jgi:hypothetical protein
MRCGVCWRRMAPQQQRETYTPIKAGCGGERETRAIAAIGVVALGRGRGRYVYMEEPKV